MPLSDNCGNSIELGFCNCRKNILNGFSSNQLPTNIRVEPVSQVIFILLNHSERITTETVNNKVITRNNTINWINRFWCNLFCSITKFLPGNNKGKQVLLNQILPERTINKNLFLNFHWIYNPGILIYLTRGFTCSK